MKPVIIETSLQMETLLSRISEAKLIAVDTEFFRETTYYPQLALVQIATDNIVACIDPLAFDAKPALKKVLLDKSIVKIFHSCSQDLEVLFYYLGEIPTSIYDTQLANALLSDHHQIGYAALVENELGVVLDKSQTRTNWLQRPLTDKQIQYAGDDVLFLYQLHHKLDKKLHDSGRTSWFEEDSNALNEHPGTFEVAPDKLWRRVKGASKLNRGQLAIAQAIAIWREQQAQKKDKTRRKVLNDDTVNKLACSAPADINTLKQTIPNNQAFTEDDMQALLLTISTAKNSSPETWPDNRFQILSPEQKQLLKKLQKIISDSAEDLVISSAILCSKKDLESLILQHEGQHKSAPEKLNCIRGWRGTCIGAQLIETINEAK